MNIYTIHGIEMTHISEFAAALSRSVTSTRHLVEDGNTIRKLKAFRDRSRLMIPISEIYGYPFIERGPGNNRKIFHFRKLEGERYKKYLCDKCTFGHGCEERKIADAVNCPKGDD